MNTPILIAATVIGAVGIAVVANDLTSFGNDSSHTIAEHCQFDVKPHARHLEMIQRASACSRIALRHHYPDGTTKDEVMQSETLAMRVIQTDPFDTTYFTLRDTDPDAADQRVRERLYPAD